MSQTHKTNSTQCPTLSTHLDLSELDERHDDSSQLSCEDQKDENEVYEKNTSVLRDCSPNSKEANLK